MKDFICMYGNFRPQKAKSQKQLQKAKSICFSSPWPFPVLFSIASFFSPRKTIETRKYILIFLPSFCLRVGHKEFLTYIVWYSSQAPLPKSWQHRTPSIPRRKECCTDRPRRISTDRLCCFPRLLTLDHTLLVQSHFCTVVHAYTKKSQ